MSDKNKSMNVHVDPPTIDAPSMGVKIGLGQKHLKDEKRPAEHDQPVAEGPAKNGS